jgi:hypothetical protein
LQDPPKFTKSGIFGLKIFHLATLLSSTHAAKFLNRVCVGMELKLEEKKRQNFFRDKNKSKIKVKKYK